MTERTATFCGYALFGIIFLLVSVGTWSVIKSRSYLAEDNSLDPVTIKAHIGINTSPPILYVVAHIKKDHHIYSISSKTPEPIRTVLSVDPSLDFELVGEWFVIIEPKLVTIPGFGDIEEHTYGTVWGIRIISKIDIETLKVHGTITVTASSDDCCYLPEKIIFEATVIK